MEIYILQYPIFSRWDYKKNSNDIAKSKNIKVNERKIKPEELKILLDVF